MFFQGKVYKIDRATIALQLSIQTYIRERVDASKDAMERFEQIEGEANSLRVCRFMVKHLIPEFPLDQVNEENKAFLLRMIHLRHTDPDREQAREIIDRRRYENQEQEEAVSDRAGSGEA